jgi:prepilin-type N-terminal cleavage/methylation domain-containing protein
MNNTIRKITRKGFTIPELITAIVVIGILMTIVVVAYNGVQASARDKSVLADIETVDGLEARCGLTAALKAECENTGSDVAKAWYSGDGVDSKLLFTPSPGNVIDVVSNSTDYCIRVYNEESASYKTLASAATKGSSSGACGTLPASSGAVADSP